MYIFFVFLGNGSRDRNYLNEIVIQSWSFDRIARQIIVLVQYKRALNSLLQPERSLSKAALARSILRNDITCASCSISTGASSLDTRLYLLPSVFIYSLSLSFFPSAVLPKPILTAGYSSMFENPTCSSEFLYAEDY